MTVDDDMKKKYDAAKDETERTEALVAASESELSRLSVTIEDGLAELLRLAEEYAGLSLSGCFSGPLEKAIRLMEEHCKSMEEQGVGRDQLETMRGGLKDMKKRLDVLRKAQEKGMATGAVQVQGGATAMRVLGAVQGWWMKR